RCVPPLVVNMRLRMPWVFPPMTCWALPGMPCTRHSLRRRSAQHCWRKSIRGRRRSAHSTSAARGDVAIRRGSWWQASWPVPRRSGTRRLRPCRVPTPAESEHCLSEFEEFHCVAGPDTLFVGLGHVGVDLVNKAAAVGPFALNVGKVGGKHNAVYP